MEKQIQKLSISIETFLKSRNSFFLPQIYILHELLDFPYICGSEILIIH